MNKLEAKNLVLKTFEQPFDESRFLFFIKNLLNELDETKFQVWAGNYIPESFRGAIKFYKRIGQYTDKNKNAIDVLIVNVKRDNTLERARTLQRNFIARHLRQRNHEAALVAFYAEDYDDWRFSLVIMELNLTKTKVEIELSPAKRYSFLVGVNERSHTAQNQFVNLLSDKKDRNTLNEIAEAFNIETVTKEFFLEYRDLFIRTKKSLDKILSVDPKVKNEFEKKGVDSVNFAKKLLGQIVFLYFLQKKGWFGVGRDDQWGEGSRKFLRELLEGKHSNFDNFFNDILEPLFYQVLRVGEDRKHLDYYYSPFNCRIPFLNGGLFDPIGDYDWVHTDITLPNELFSNNKKTPAGDIGNGILDIFDRYNFTVIEDEPLEKEVAIDPELLGKAYEKFNAIRPDNFDEYLKALKSGKKGEETKFNKQYGVYYTPREIVHYMCQQSLVNYLTTMLKGKASKEAIEFLIIEGDKFIEHLKIAKEKNEESENYKGDYKEDKRFVELKNNAEDLDRALSSVNVCDPAVGSGAFPVGMMSEIIKARMFFVLTNCLLGQYVNPHNDKVDRSSYNYKRDCIENSLYGVDIDAGAVEIAKLRLWLSLVVDEDDIHSIRPLPNLDYKIVKGNSLIGFPNGVVKNIEIEKEIEFLKIKYFGTTDVYEKRKLKSDIEVNITKLIEEAKHFSDKVLDVSFDFEFYFSEVFHKKSGFDIIIANPPYVNIENLGSSLKDYLYHNYETCIGRTDIYVPFIDQSISLLNKSGSLAFIIPYAFTNQKYGTVLRKKIIENNHIIEILDTSEFFVFEATVKNIVLIMSKQKKDTETLIKRVKSFYDFKQNNFETHNLDQRLYLKLKDYRLETKPVLDNLSLKEKITKDTLAFYEICFIAYGARINHRSKPITKDYYLHKEYKNGYKPFIEGKNIERYFHSQNGWLNYCPNEHYNSMFPELFENKKIMFINVVKDRLRFSFDNQHLYNSHTVINCVLWFLLKKSSHSSIKRNKTELRVIQSSNYDYMYLLAILNSKLINWYFLNFLSEKLHFYPDDAKQLPIKKLDKSKQIDFISTTAKILECKSTNSHADTKQLEDQLDIMVYKLYNLTYEEVKIIDPNIEQLISKEDYENFKIE